MVHIQFAGTAETLRNLQKLLGKDADISPSLLGDFLVCEVKTFSDLSNIPSRPDKPLFIYLDTTDKIVISRLKTLPISGIFTPRTDAGAMMLKFNNSLKNTAPESIEKFEMLKVKILAKADAIPALPVFAQRLISLTNSSVSTMKEITAQIKMDQGLASKLIRMANSPFYMVRQHVNSIDMAAVLLGFQSLKNIALAVSANTYYDKQFSMYNTTGSAMCSHSYITALLCEALAQIAGADSDALFLAGLFHDIGKTIIVDFLVKPVASVTDEREQLGMDHAEVAGMVLRRWQLSDDVCDNVRLHHNPDESVNSRIVSVANRLAHISAIPNLLEDSFMREIDSAQAQLPSINMQTAAPRLKKILDTSAEIIL